MDRTMWRGLARFSLLISALLALQGFSVLIRLLGGAGGWWDLILLTLIVGTLMLGIVALVMAKHATDPMVRAHRAELPKLRFEYDLRYAEMFRISGFRFDKRWVIPATCLLVGVFVAGIVVLVSAKTPKDLFLGILLIGLTGGLFIGLIVMVVVFFVASRLATKPWHYKVTFDSNGWHATRTKYRTFQFQASWAALRRVRETAEGFALRPRWFMMHYALFVPRRVFADEVAQERFRSLLRERMGHFRRP